MKQLFLAALFALGLGPLTVTAQTFPGAEAVGFDQSCFVPIMSTKTPGKILYWNIAVSCTADRERTNGAAEKQEALDRLEAEAL